MSARLTLICHAATTATRAAAFATAHDPVEPAAIDRARRLASHLRRADRLWTSPALCARQTAEAMSLDATVEPALGDCDYGRWAGQDLVRLQATEPGAVQAWLTDLEVAPHGGESLADLCRRTSRWIDTLPRDRGHRIAITHASVMRAAVLHVLGAPAAAFWRIDIEPLGLIDLRGDGRRWALRMGTPAP